MTRKLSKKQISYRLSLRYAQKYLEDFLKGKQNPDNVTYIKHWDEFRYLKGWWLRIEYYGIESNLEITIDLNPYYGRIIGETDKIPDFIPGKHQHWDYDENKHKISESEKAVKLYEKLWTEKN